MSITSEPGPQKTKACLDCMSEHFVEHYLQTLPVQWSLTLTAVFPADIDGVVAELGRLRSSLGSSEEEFGFLANLLQSSQLQSLVQVSEASEIESEGLLLEAK